LTKLIFNLNINRNVTNYINMGFGQKVELKNITAKQKTGPKIGLTE